MRTWVIALAICAIYGTGCSAMTPFRPQESVIAHRIIGTELVKWAVTKQFQGNAFIKSASLTDRAVIEITFRRDMKPETLNPSTIRVVSEKQARDVTDALSFEYDPLNQRLALRPRDPQFDFGTGNVVTICVSSEVRDLSGIPQGEDSKFSFGT